MSSGWAAGHARHLGRCDKEAPGEKRRSGRSSGKTIVLASGEVPRLPLHPPARDDNGGVRRERSAVCVGSSAARVALDRPVGQCHVERVGGRACETSRPMRQGTSRRKASQRDGRPAKRILLALGEVPRLPLRPPARDDNGDLRERVTAHALDRAAALRSRRDRPPVSCRAGGRPGMRDISVDATRNLRGENQRSEGRPAKGSFSHRGRSLACPSTHPLGTTMAEVVARDHRSAWIERGPLLSTDRPPFSCRAGGRPGMRDISVDATRNLRGEKRRSGGLSGKRVVLASGEVPRLPLHPPARDDHGGGCCERSAALLRIEPRPVALDETVRHCHVERVGGRACETSRSMRQGTSRGRSGEAEGLSGKRIVLASGEVPRLPLHPPARDDHGGGRCKRSPVCFERPGNPRRRSGEGEGLSGRRTVLASGRSLACPPPPARDDKDEGPFEGIARHAVHRTARPVTST